MFPRARKRIRMPGMILIFESDPLARTAIESALAEHKLADGCSVIALGKKPGGSAHIYIGDAGSEKNGDHFSKPLRIGTLLDRVRWHIAKATRTEGAEIFFIGPYELDCRNNALKNSKTKKIIRLTEKERHILEVLARNDGARVERKALLDEVWGYGENIETHTLETHIYRLRQKIERDPAAPEILKTDESGYRIAL